MPVKTIYLCMEVVGCPTICQHCWAQGVPYPAMPLGEIAWALDAGAPILRRAGARLRVLPDA